MYRDDPLDDEFELRAIVGDDAVDGLVEAARDLEIDPVEAAMDALRVLQGWMGDDAAARWFHLGQRRLDDRTPLDVLADGGAEEVLDAARAYAAAHG